MFSVAGVGVFVGDESFAVEARVVDGEAGAEEDFAGVEGVGEYLADGLAGPLRYACGGGVAGGEVVTEGVDGETVEELFFDFDDDEGVGGMRVVGGFADLAGSGGPETAFAVAEVGDDGGV